MFFLLSLSQYEVVFDKVITTIFYNFFYIKINSIISLITFFLFLLKVDCLVAQSKITTPPEGKLIKINHASRLVFDKTLGIDAQRLISAILFTQNN